MEVDIAMIGKIISDIFLNKKATITQEAKQLRQEIYMLEQKREVLCTKMEQLQLQHKTSFIWIRISNSLLVKMRLFILITVILGANL